MSTPKAEELGTPESQIHRDLLTELCELTELKQTRIKRAIGLKETEEREASLVARIGGMLEVCSIMHLDKEFPNAFGKMIERFRSDNARR